MLKKITILLFTLSALFLLRRPAQPAFLESASKVTFEAARAGIKTKLLFPRGQPIVPTYALGIPLGAEKPLLEPALP